MFSTHLDLLPEYELDLAWVLGLYYWVHIVVYSVKHLLGERTDIIEDWSHCQSDLLQACKIDLRTKLECVQGLRLDFGYELLPGELWCKSHDDD